MAVATASKVSASPDADQERPRLLLSLAPVGSVSLGNGTGKFVERDRALRLTRTEDTRDAADGGGVRYVRDGDNNEYFFRADASSDDRQSMMERLHEALLADDLARAVLADRERRLAKRGEGKDAIPTI